MVWRVLWKKDGWAGDAGMVGGKTPTFASFASRYAIEGILSVRAISEC